MELRNAVVFSTSSMSPPPSSPQLFCFFCSSFFKFIAHFPLQKPPNSSQKSTSLSLSRNPNLICIVLQKLIVKMASFTVPCPKVSPPLAAMSQKSQRIASFPRSECRLVPPSMLAIFKGFSQSLSDAFKVSAQLNEVAVEKVSLEKELLKESKSQYEIPDAESISVFMDQVSDLIKLVDSRDIVELQLKQMDCELVIRKKEALPQPSTSAPVFYAPPPTPPATFAPQPPTPASAGIVPSTPSAPALPAPAKPKSSHPPFKCPMAGNFYRSPAPGAPAFVKVGDKVQKGQVICIIEAMKLMNEIEADQSGTVVEILADDGKPVSVDTPLFIIEP